MSVTPTRSVIAHNMTELRLSSNLTQLELAAALNYSDKAVSKWERGESMPDIEVLLKLARYYGVTLDYLVEDNHPDPKEQRRSMLNHQKRNHGFIIIMSVLSVWLIACLVYFILTSIFGYGAVFTMCFLYAVPASVVVGLVLNSVWFRGKNNHVIISFLMWSLLLTGYISILVFAKRSLPMFFILGIPGQAIIILWSKLGVKEARYIKANRYEDPQ